MVNISGVGSAPEGTDSKLGKCSQMACFVRKDLVSLLSSTDSNENLVSNQETIDEDDEVIFPINKFQYRHLFKYVFPKKPEDTRSQEEIVLDEVKYFINRHAYNDNNIYFNYEKNSLEIPLKDFVPYVHNIVDENELRGILQKTFAINEMDCVIHEIEDSGSSDLNDEYYDDNIENNSNEGVRNADEGDSSDWA